MLPKDPIILLSYMNTQLRDFYPSLEEFGDSTGENPEEIASVLEQIGYRYDPEQNRFVRK